MAGHFQTRINQYLPVGIEGGLAGTNPKFIVPSGEAAFIADPTFGCTVARFAWQDVTGAFMSNFTTGDVEPDGVIANTMNALITTFEGGESMTIPAGKIIEVFQMAEIFMRANVVAAAVGNKVFANIFDGSSLAGAKGSFPVYPSGTAAVFSATFATTVMTVTAVTSGNIQKGDLILGAGLPFNTRVASLGNGTGGTGTYNLTTTPGTITPAIACTSVAAQSVGGATCTATFATSIMTVNAVSAGVLVPGQLVKAAGVASGTYIVSQNPGGTVGGAGTYNLSTTPGTITPAVTTLLSAWVETDWKVKVACGAGELMTIQGSI